LLPPSAFTTQLAVALHAAISQPTSRLLNQPAKKRQMARMANGGNEDKILWGWSEIRLNMVSLFRDDTRRRSKLKRWQS
jgi:hypothetical protein